MADKQQLPDDGTRVKAMTFENISEDLEPREVEGELTTRVVEAFDGYIQAFVDGVQVDPDTVKAVEEEEKREE